VQEIGQKIMLFSMILTVRNTLTTPRDLGKFGYRFWYQPFSKKAPQGRFLLRFYWVTLLFCTKMGGVYFGML
jgi:hypothetical protein